MVTIRREAGGWYAGCSCAHVPTMPLPCTGGETGTDLGLKVFLITADGDGDGDGDGEAEEHPHHHHTAQRSGWPGPGAGWRGASRAAARVPPQDDAGAGAHL